MINWPTHRPPHGSNRTEIRVAEQLRSLADSPHPWTVIWGFYLSSKSGLCDPADVLILHAQSDIGKSPLGDRPVLAGDRQPRPPVAGGGRPAHTNPMRLIPTGPPHVPAKQRVPETPCPLASWRG